MMIDTVWFISFHVTVILFTVCGVEVTFWGGGGGVKIGRTCSLNENNGAYTHTLATSKVLNSLHLKKTI